MKNLKAKVASVKIDPSDLGSGLIALYVKVKKCKEELNSRGLAIEVFRHNLSSLNQIAREKIKSALSDFVKMSGEELIEFRESFCEIMTKIKWLEENDSIELSEVLFLTDYLRKNIILKIDKQYRISKYGLSRITKDMIFENPEGNIVINTVKETGLYEDGIKEIPIEIFDRIYVDKDNMFHIWSPSGWVNYFSEDCKELIESIEYSQGHFIARYVERHGENKFFKEYLCKVGFGGWIYNGTTNRFCGRINAIKGGFEFFETPYTSKPCGIMSICCCDRNH